MENQKITQLPVKYRGERKRTFVNDNGKWVIKGAKKSAEIVYDVTRVYSELLLGLLELSIKVGLFLFLLPHISEFLSALIEVLTK